MLLAGSVDNFDGSSFASVPSLNQQQREKQQSTAIACCCSRALPSTAAVFANASTHTATDGMWVAVCRYVAVHSLQCHQRPGQTGPAQAV